MFYLVIFYPVCSKLFSQKQLQWQLHSYKPECPINRKRSPENKPQILHCFCKESSRYKQEYIHFPACKKLPFIFSNTKQKIKSKSKHKIRKVTVIINPPLTIQPFTCSTRCSKATKSIISRLVFFFIMSKLAIFIPLKQILLPAVTP